jgi:hypothetical protein
VLLHSQGKTSPEASLGENSLLDDHFLLRGHLNLFFKLDLVTQLALQCDCFLLFDDLT